MITKFSPEVIENLKCYVYLYLDPATNEIFYVGKGRGNRVFAHLNDETGSDKIVKINEIRGRGQEPKIEILVHGLDDDEARKIEAIVIDLIGIKSENLTNKVRGWQAGIYGRMNIDEITSLYCQEIEIEEPAILVPVDKIFRSSRGLYNATRERLRVDEKGRKAEYVFSINEGIVKAVYEIKTWLPGPSTFKRRTDGTIQEIILKEFIGDRAAPEIWDKYINKSVRKYFLDRDTKDSICYVNI
ncbi:MAG: hypothetical protein DPW09_31125 [Anaerolineae bacterium]|nr:hypothetical protein [Anaerolineae bacterium]